MRFTAAWSNVLSQNMTLRVALLLVSVCAVIFSIATVKLSMRVPLVIERGCYSSVAAVSDGKHTRGEIESFIDKALSKRFDSSATDAVLYLSDEEYAFRMKEQTEFEKKAVKQRVLAVPGSIVVEGSSIRLAADRLLSVGKIKSILPLFLNIEIASVDRTDGNPYGLVIKSVKEAKPKEDLK